MTFHGRGLTAQEVLALGSCRQEGVNLIPVRRNEHTGVFGELLRTVQRTAAMAGADSAEDAGHPVPAFFSGDLDAAKAGPQAAAARFGSTSGVIDVPSNASNRIRWVFEDSRLPRGLQCFAYVREELTTKRDKHGKPIPFEQVLRDLPSNQIARATAQNEKEELDKTERPLIAGAFKHMKEANLSFARLEPGWYVRIITHVFGARA